MTEPIKLTPYKEWKAKYETEKVHTRKEMHDALEKIKQECIVNRVIQTFTGRIGPDETRAMQILAIHKTSEGITVIVK